ncbi:MAG: D-alanyl-D-alanine carboxypeptidase family protein [Porcipelethomonas sp.]
MGATKQEKNKGYTAKRCFDVALAAVLAVGAIFGIKTITKDFKEISRKNGDDSSISVSSNDSQPENEFIYVSDSADNENVYSGPLILVNSEKKYQGNSDGLVSMFDVKEKAKSEGYSVYDKDVKLRNEAAQQLDKMLTAFSSETGITDIQVTGGYRSIETQQEYYDAADDISGVSAPGYSDYHTGYSADIDVISDDGESMGFDGTGDYAWFAENCYKYGFVVRSPEDKTDITGLAYRPWHFRYVGIPHSYYMHEKNLCLEEYSDLLKKYSYEIEHLNIEADGKSYETYYILMDASSSTTIISVPSSKEYTVSGNNTDGFIITVDLDSDTSVEEETAPPSDDSSKDDAESSEKDSSEEQ